MKKWFVGLMVLLALVLASSTAMALVYEIWCENCQKRQDFEPTGRYIAAPNDAYHLEIYRCPGCGQEQGTGYDLPHKESKAATCISQAYCADCNKYYGGTDPDNHAYEIVYNKVDEVYHTKEEVCSRCKTINYSLTEKHTPKEAATCMSAAICAGCNAAYGSPNPDAHNWSDWALNQFNPNLHYRYCMNIGCSASESESHDGNSNCVTSAKCSKCRTIYYDMTKHVGPFTYTYEKIDESFHKRIETCTACGNKTGNQVETKHEESTPAECTHAAWCNVCNQAYGDPNPDNHRWGNWTYENENLHYRICAHNESHIQHADHRGYATCIDSMPCLDCGLSYKDPDKHQGPYTYAYASSASSANLHTVTETCTACGKISRTYDEDHDLELHAAQAPTCFHVGWNAYEACQREGCGYTTYEEIPMLVHWYAEWMPNEDDTHTAACRQGCQYAGTVPCTFFTYQLKSADQAVEVTLCPVCGEVSDGTRLMLAEAAEKAVTGKLPAGEIVVRMGTLESGEVLMSVAFEIGGKLTQPTGQVKLTLPAEVLEGYTLSLLAEDGTETELTRNAQDGSFVLDFSGASSPVRVIRLVPVAA